MNEEIKNILAAAREAAKDVASQTSQGVIAAAREAAKDVVSQTPQDVIAAAQKAAEGYLARFKRPEINETALLLATFKSRELSVMARYAEEFSSLKRAMESWA